MRLFIKAGWKEDEAEEGILITGVQTDPDGDLLKKFLKTDRITTRPFPAFRAAPHSLPHTPTEM